MNKRVLCILLAAALLCVPALASGTHEVSVTFDSAMAVWSFKRAPARRGQHLFLRKARLDV